MAVAETNLIVHEVRYEVTLEHVAKLGEKFKGLTATTADGYEQVRLAIADLRGIRGRIEARRVELKKDALEYGRKVDGVARQLTEAIEEIEQPLKVEKGKVDDERARAKAAQEAAERAEAEAKLRAEREAEEARLRAAREAEEARIREEREKLEADKAAAAAERERQDAANRAEQERIRAEQAKLEAERRAFEEKKRQAEQEEAQRQAKIRADKEAAEKAERDRAAVEKARQDEAARAELARQRAAAMRPDVEKVAAFAEAIRVLAIPEVADQEAKTVVELASGDLEDIVTNLQAWIDGHRASEAA